MDDHESDWSDWALELPDELQPNNRIAWFDESLTTGPNPSTHFVVSKSSRRFRYFEVEWNNHVDRRRWREIDQEECRSRTRHVAGYHSLWHLAFPGHLNLIVNAENRTVRRVGYQAVVVLPPIEFDLFQIMYKAGEHGASKDAVDNYYKGKGTGIRERKKELRNCLIPLSVSVNRSWGIVDDVPPQESDAM